MNLNDYFDPVSLPKPENQYLPDKELFSHNIDIHTPSREISKPGNYKIALIGVRDFNDSNDELNPLASDIIRESLYQLQFTRIKGFNIIDLGNLKSGNTEADSFQALQDVIHYLSTEGLMMILLGGSQKLTSPIFKSLHHSPINLAILDQRIDLWSGEKNLNAQNYLNDILTNEEKLFNFSSIGHQLCLTPQHLTEKEIADHHELFRLGEFREDLRVAEPAIRDSDFLSIDISVVKQAEAPAGAHQTPNGIRSEELCQLTWYAGFGERTSCIAFFEYLPTLDVNGLTGNLIAQGIWYFLEGIRLRKNETPPSPKGNMRQFMIEMDEPGQKMIFYKSLDTDRWWVELPPERNSEPPKIIACRYEDYKNASNRIIPARWFRFFRKYD